MPHEAFRIIRVLLQLGKHLTLVHEVAHTYHMGHFEMKGWAIRFLRVILLTDHTCADKILKTVVSLTMTKVIESIVWIFIRNWQ